MPRAKRLAVDGSTNLKAHYYIRYETFQNDGIAYDLTGDEQRSSTVLDTVDIPFHAVEQIVGADAVLHCVEETVYGARDWIAHIKADELEVEAIKKLAGPFVLWLTPDEYNEILDAKIKRF